MSRNPVSVQDEDAFLLARARAGDRDALTLLLTRHEAALLRLCGGILGGVPGGSSGGDAADAVQETFLRALRVLMDPKGFRGDASVRTYLFRIAVHVCLEWRRRPATVSLLPGESEATVAAGDLPERVAIDRVRIAQALSQLPPRQRTLLILREQEGYSAREIAALLSWNEKRVHNELFKMRQQLLRLREANGGEE